MPLSARSRDTNSFERKWAFEMCERVWGGGGVNKHNFLHHLFGNLSGIDNLDQIFF